MSSFIESKLFKKYPASIIAEAREELLSIVPRCGMPIYASIDLRDSGARLVAVDVNLFPAGFNNLSVASLAKASSYFAKFLEKKIGHAAPWKVTLIPESHTNNEGYLQNIGALISLMEAAGAEVKLAWVGMPIPKKWDLKYGESKILSYYPAEEAINWAEALVLNHDMSGGPLEALANIDKRVFPSPALGWYKRKKSEHFDIARKVLDRLAQKIPKIDPLDFFARSRSLDELNFDSKENVEKLIDTSAQFLEELKTELREENPFVYMKNDSGTYGMGIWKFSSLEELKGAAKLLQKRFYKGKQGVRVRRILLQEGIRTRFVHGSALERSEFEPVIYSVNGANVGGFFRAFLSGVEDHLGESNLNNPKAWFEDERRFADDYEKMSDLYDFVSLLHSVSAAIEDCPQ